MSFYDFIIFWLKILFCWKNKINCFIYWSFCCLKILITWCLKLVCYLYFQTFNFCVDACGYYQIKEQIYLSFQLIYASNKIMFVFKIILFCLDAVLFAIFLYIWSVWLCFPTIRDATYIFLIFFTSLGFYLFNYEFLFFVTF